MGMAEDLKDGSRGKGFLRVGVAGAKAKGWECVWPVVEAVRPVVGVRAMMEGTK